jgi:hypothetical protein
MFVDPARRKTFDPLQDFVQGKYSEAQNVGQWCENQVGMVWHNQSYAQIVFSIVSMNAAVQNDLPCPLR